MKGIVLFILLALVAVGSAEAGLVRHGAKAVKFTAKAVKFTAKAGAHYVAKPAVKAVKFLVW